MKSGLKVIRTLNLEYRKANTSHMCYQREREKGGRKIYIKERQKGTKGTELQRHHSIHPFFFHGFATVLLVSHRVATC